ncbi:MAG TPA: hypothetical protein VGP37_05290 [Candidatus Nanopelagicales bacterium]|nr:hypothetical protein [Candidatus Nanopelagicales bacterium]
MIDRRWLVSLLAATTLPLGVGAGFADHLTSSAHRTYVVSIEPTDGVLCGNGAELRDSYGRPWPLRNTDEVFISIENLPRIWVANRCEGSVVISGPLGADGFVLSGQGVTLEPLAPGLAIIGSVNLDPPLFIQFVNFPID